MSNQENSPQEEEKNKHKSVFRRPNKNKHFASDRTWMQDRRLTLQATGLLAKMLSMPEDWEFHQAALTNVMPNGIDAIRSSMKECAKFGYLIKLPPIRNEKGQYDTIEYEVFDTPQFEGEMEDSLVKSWFSNKPNWEEIQKKIPKRDFPAWGNPALQYNTTYYTKDNNRQTSLPEEEPKPKDSLLMEKVALIKETFPRLQDTQFINVARNNTLQNLEKACELAKIQEKPIDHPPKWLGLCIRGSWWNNISEDELGADKLFQSLTDSLNEFRDKNKIRMDIERTEKTIHVQVFGGKAIEITKQMLENETTVNNLVENVNNSFSKTHKLVYVIMKGQKSHFEVLR